MNRETGSTRTTIVEYGFLDGPNLHRLKDKNYREGLYECVIQAICAEEGVPYRQASGTDRRGPNILSCCHRFLS